MHRSTIVCIEHGLFHACSMLITNRECVYKHIKYSKYLAIPDVLLSLYTVHAKCQLSRDNVI